jgi:precorrin-6A/cobalt-precorrin-6A reductase
VTVLILGGTGEARELASSLIAEDVPVISSLAGRVARPRLPEGDVRVGGFGGPDGLAAWLADHSIAAVVDATHPFAETISASATAACAMREIPLLRLERPGWSETSEDRWAWVDDLSGAADALPRLGTRVFLTTGRQGLSAFSKLDDLWFLIRCVDPPQVELPARHELLLDRGPYTVDGELTLIDTHGLDVVVTKDSGGSLTEAKLEAARRRGLPVVVVRRPPRPASHAVADVESSVAWVASSLSRAVT